MPPGPSRDGRDATHNSIAALLPGLPIGRGGKQPLSDQYFALAHEMLRRLPADQGSPVLVTSPGRGEGKTTVALGLGIVLQRDFGYRTIVVDASQPFPFLHKALAVPPAPGLTDVIFQSLPLPQAIRQFRELLPDVLLAGSPVPPMAGLIRTAPIAGVLAELARSYRAVIVDGPGLTSGMQAELLSEAIANTLIVVRLHRTADSDLKGAIERCRGRSILGIVVNGTRNPG